MELIARPQELVHGKIELHIPEGYEHLDEIRLTRANPISRSSSPGALTILNLAHSRAATNKIDKMVKIVVTTVTTVTSILTVHEPVSRTVH